MLTKKQIEELPKGTYTNMQLMAMFPKQQGKGRSFYNLKTLQTLKETIKTN